MSLSNENNIIESNKNEEKKLNTNQIQNNEINKNLYIKFIKLKNVLIEERKKISLLEKENKSLKEENQKKNETILELKDEIQKYHDIISNKSKSNFFTELFSNINISDIKNEFSINKLTSENSDLKQKIQNLNTELNSLKENFEKIVAELSQQKINFDNKIKLYEKEKEISQNKLIQYEKENFNLKRNINALNSDRKYIEENITKLKKEIKQKNEDLDKLIKEQENIINNNTEYKQKIKNLKNIISQYKKAIDNTTEIKEDYIFIGKIIPNTHYNNIININNDKNIDIFLNMENKINNINKQESYSNIKIMFNFNHKKIGIIVENKNPIIIEAKDIIDIVENLHIEGQIKIFYKIKESVFDYLCQFTKKEADYIIHFYKELKNNDHIDPALYAAYLGTQ